MPNVLQPSLSNTPSYKNITETSAITPYATDLLQRGQSFTTAETPVYEGQLTAGPSQYQNQAWQGLANLTVPKNITEAGNQLGNISQQQQGLGYTPGNITSTYNAAGGNYNPLNVTNAYTPAGQNYGPSNITSGYNPAVGNYTASNIGSGYDASVGNYNASNITNTYNPAAGAYKQYDVQADTFNRDQARQYMNPYIEAALNPQLDLQQRRAAMNQQGDMAKLAQAGAFGGSRQAILQGLNQENLLRQQAETTGAGYEKAYANAQNQFNADQARKMEATKANIQQAQKAADLGMSDAQMMAQYGMTAQQANESSRQFAQNQRMTAADRAAQYSLDSQKANEASRQFGKTQEMAAADRAAQYGMTAQQANEASRQFAQTQKMTDAERLAQYGLDATKANIQQAQKAADLGMSDAELTARYGMDAQKANEASRQFAAGYRQQGLSNAANTEQARAQAGGQEAQYGLANLNALSAAGAQQQDLEQSALDAQYKDWLRQTEYPGKQIDQMKGLVTGLTPVLPKTETIYGQKEKAASTAAGVLGGVASALGIKTMDDLVKKAGQYGLTVDNFKKMLGITGELPKELGKEGQAADPGEKARTGLEEPTEEDARGGGGGGGIATDPILPPEGDENVAEEYGGYGGGYSGAAQGGLVDLLHKMRSHK